jgi:hypothetical protein
VTVLLILVGAAVTEVALWGRRQQARASREAGQLDGVLTTVGLVAASRESTTSLADQVGSQIVDLLRIDSASSVRRPASAARTASCSRTEASRGQVSS